MDDSGEPVHLTGKDLIDFLEDAIAKVRRGELEPMAMRLRRRDGTWEDLAVGFDTDQERDAAMGKLLRMLGQLH